LFEKLCFQGRVVSSVKTAPHYRDEFIASINHIRSALTKVITNSGPTMVLSAPDVHKISEGLFLSAVTHWEELCQKLLICDLASDSGSLLRKDIKKFRTKSANLHLAESLVTHIDHPDRFYDWSDFGCICKRADVLLSSGHRFAAPQAAPGAPKQSTVLSNAVCDELAIFRRIRNAIAHKSDKAWSSFLKLVTDPPFQLQAKQRKGITPGRFLVTQQWVGKVVLHHALDTLEAAAQQLVP
jgi:hypothetical protein